MQRNIYYRRIHITGQTAYFKVNHLRQIKLVEGLPKLLRVPLEGLAPALRVGVEGLRQQTEYKNGEEQVKNGLLFVHSVKMPRY